MSSVTIQGNPSGTGIFTIASPNSNTNRTLNLPDQSGDFITTDSSGAAILPRVNSSNEGGQINFNRAVDNVANWSIDSFGNDTTPTLRFIDGGNVRTVIDGSGNVGIGTSSPTARLQVNGRIAVVDENVEFRRTGQTTWNVTNFGSSLFFNNGSDRMALNSGGDLLVGTMSTQDNSRVYSDNAGNRWCYIAQAQSQGGVYFYHSFRVSGVGQAGSITGNNTSTVAYNTSSDYRLKENIQPMTGALAKVAALKPCTYKWKIDGSDGQGFIAHELAEVCPDAVSGEKDAVNEDGSIKPQGIDTSFLVATLTAAIQEQQAIIEQLTTRIAALEAK